MNSKASPDRLTPAKTVLLLAGVFLFALGTVHFFISRHIVYIHYENGRFIVQDFGYHVVLTKAFWFDGVERIYTYAAQQEVVSAFVGKDCQWAMPIGITPVALLVWFPFALVARTSVAWAYSLWMALSFTLFAVGLINVAEENREEKRPFPVIMLVLLLVCCFSVLGKNTLGLGQTSIIATGVLLILAAEIQAGKRNQRPPRMWVVLLVVFICGLKPPYLLLAGGMLFAHRYFRQFVWGIVFTLLMVALLTPKLGVGWIHDYRQVLKMYQSGDLLREYAWSVEPNVMTVFSSAFFRLTGADTARTISDVVLNLGSLLLAAGVLLKEKIHFLQKISPWQYFLSFLSLYLLFAPYVGSHEDLLLVLGFGVVVLSGARPALNRPSVMAVIFLLMGVCMQRAFGFDKSILPFFIAKAAVLGWLVFLAGKKAPAS